VPWSLRGGRGTQYTQKPLKIYRKKKYLKGGSERGDEHSEAGSEGR
jgi:hypothetical protein